jgi:photosystem II stability/assembly factor-like uncharacterized protein
MSKTLLIVGTRKGAFLLESEDRRDWTVRGGYCEGWPVYHAIYDTTTGSIYAAAASEWHGSTIWRSGDLGETWEQSSEGLTYGDDDGRKISKASTLARAGDRLLVGVEAPGIFESRDNGETFSLLSTLSGQHGSEAWDDPANQPPGHLGISGFVTDADDSDRFFAIVQGVGAFETDDGGESWTPRNSGLRRDWPADYEDVGFCVHKLVRSPQDGQRMYQQNHVGMHRSDDGGQSWTEITEGLPGDFGFPAAVHPHDRDTFYVIPVDGGHDRTMHDGKATVWRTRDAGSSWQPMRKGLPQQKAHIGVLRQAMVIDTHDVPGLYFGTSTGQVFASPDEGETWSEIASYLPAISSVDVVVLD